jgi:hypothetical protein
MPPNARPQAPLAQRSSVPPTGEPALPYAAKPRLDWFEKLRDAENLGSDRMHASAPHHDHEDLVADVPRVTEPFFLAKRQLLLQ